MLRRSCPRGLTVLTAPFDVALAIDTVVQPDLLVARRVDFSEKDLPTAPLLAVEVLSPSTRHLDLGLKLRRHETAGCPSYWVVDPAGRDTEVSLTAWELRGTSYAEVARVTGEETARLELPFPVSITPARLDP